MLQSQEIENTVKAEELHAAFINKNSPTLAHEIQDFIKGYLGFGDFIFRNKNGEPIDRATSIEEFKQKLLSIPDESLIYHSIRNGISTWLMAHREITLAKHLKRYRFEDFPTPAEMRQFILRVFEAAELKKIKGRIINYNPKLVDSNRYITRLGKGSFGGKGRGMAFLSNFIENVDFKKLIPKLKIEIPKTAIIGVDEFDNFIDNNGLSRIIYSDESYEEVKAIYDSYYKNEKFVRVLDKDVCPETRWVEGSNYVDVNFKIDKRTNRIIMMGAMDNLVKGAAGQAVQNMNLMFGLKETEGLELVPMFP